MKSLRPVGIACALLTVILSAAEARAALVTYQFSGTCFSGSSPGDCGFFGLSDGDLISGSITLDGEHLGTSGFTSFLPTDPDLDFSFRFGDFSVGKTHLDPGLVIRVMLSDSGEAGIVFQNPIVACIGALFPCYARQDGTEALSIGTSFGSADRYVGIETQTAYTLGAWTLSPVPEPSVTQLFALALALAGLASRKRCKTAAATVIREERGSA